MAHTKGIGLTSEAKILTAFVQAGFPVLLPFGEDHRYDMVIEAGGRFLRVQVKTASPCGNGDRACVRFHAYSHRFIGGKFSGREAYRGDADLFAVYAPTTGKVYVLPVDQCPVTDVWLRLTPAKNGQRSGIRMAENHTLEAWAAWMGQAATVRLPSASPPTSRPHGSTHHASGLSLNMGGVYRSHRRHSRSVAVSCSNDAER